MVQSCAQVFSWCFSLPLILKIETEGPLLFCFESSIHLYPLDVPEKKSPASVFISGSEDQAFVLP